VHVEFVCDQVESTRRVDLSEVLLLQRRGGVLASLALDPEEQTCVAPDNIGNPTLPVSTCGGVEVVSPQTLEVFNNNFLDFSFRCNWLAP